MNNNSTCKKCTNFRQVGELSHDEWLRRVNNQGWKGGRSGWIHAASHTTMSHNQVMEFFKVGDTPYPPGWDEVEADTEPEYAINPTRFVVSTPGVLEKNEYGGWTFTPDNNLVNVSAGITGVLKDE